MAHESSLFNGLGCPYLTDVTLRKPNPWPARETPRIPQCVIASRSDFSKTFWKQQANLCDIAISVYCRYPSNEKDEPTVNRNVLRVTLIPRPGFQGNSVLNCIRTFRRS